MRRRTAGRRAAAAPGVGRATSPNNFFWLLPSKMEGGRVEFLCLVCHTGLRCGEQQDVWVMGSTPAQQRHGKRHFWSWSTLATSTAGLRACSPSRRLVRTLRVHRAVAAWYSGTLWEAMINSVDRDGSATIQQLTRAMKKGSQSPLRFQPANG